MFIYSLCQIVEAWRFKSSPGKSLENFARVAKFRNPTIEAYGEEEDKNGNTVAETVLVKK